MAQFHHTYFKLSENKTISQRKLKTLTRKHKSGHLKIIYNFLRLVQSQNGEQIRNLSKKSKGMNRFQISNNTQYDIHYEKGIVIADCWKKSN